MKTMEAWLAELEMEVNQVPNLVNNPCHHQYETTEEATYTEELSATLGEDFPYPYPAMSKTSSPDQWDVDNIIIEQFITPPQITEDTQQMKDDMNNKQATRGGAKRKRQPNQVQDHIIAERRRRELLSQMFISLSSLVPGLKKMDKTSVLGEAINYMKKLQENVKTLEEVVAKRTVESVVVVRKSQLIVNDNNGDDNDSFSTVDDNSASSNSGGSGGGGGGGGGGCEDNKSTDSFPEIEVRVSGNTLLLKVYCENKKGILTKLFQELEKHDLSVTNCSAVPFDSLALDITIVAQLQRGYNMNAESFVRKLHSAFRLSSR